VDATVETGLDGADTKQISFILFSHIQLHLVIFLSGFELF